MTLTNRRAPIAFWGVMDLLVMAAAQHNKVGLTVFGTFMALLPWF